MENLLILFMYLEQGENIKDFSNYNQESQISILKKVFKCEKNDCSSMEKFFEKIVKKITLKDLLTELDNLISIMKYERKTNFEMTKLVPFFQY